MSFSLSSGIFIYCAGPGYNGTELVDSSEGGEDDGSGSGSGSGSSSASSSSEEADGSSYEVGCKRIDLENQGSIERDSVIFMQYLLKKAVPCIGMFLL